MLIARDHRFAICRMGSQLQCSCCDNTLKQRRSCRFSLPSLSFLAREARRVSRVSTLNGKWSTLCHAAWLFCGPLYMTYAYTCDIHIPIRYTKSPTVPRCHFCRSSAHLSIDSPRLAASIGQHIWSPANSLQTQCLQLLLFGFQHFRPGQHLQLRGLFNGMALTKLKTGCKLSGRGLCSHYLHGKVFLREKLRATWNLTVSLSLSPSKQQWLLSHTSLWLSPTSSRSSRSSRSSN